MHAAGGPGRVEGASMRRGSAAAVALVLSAVCVGCENWSGFGFRADSREMPRLRQVLALETGRVVQAAAPGKGDFTSALPGGWGPNGHAFPPGSAADRYGRSRGPAFP